MFLIRLLTTHRLTQHPISHVGLTVDSESSLGKLLEVK